MTRMNDRRTNPLITLFVQTWRYSKPHQVRVALFWGMFVCAESIHLFAAPLLVAHMINIIQQHGMTHTSLSTLLTLLALIWSVDVVFWALHGPARIIECENAFTVRKNYRSELLKGVMTLPLTWHTDHHSGDTIDKIEKGASALYQFSEYSFQIVYALVRLVGSYAVLSYFSHSASLIVGGMIALTAWIIMQFDNMLVAQYQELNRAENRVSESVFDAISNITTIIVLRVEKFVFAAIRAHIEKPFVLFRRNIRVNEVKWFLVDMCCNATTALVLGIYFFQSIGNTTGILIGNVYLLIKYLDSINNVFFHAAQLYGDILQRRAKVMNAEELARDFVNASFSNHVLPSQWRLIEVQHLTFSYDQNGEEDGDLCDISFTLSRGERIAFIGESGSGKTTCMNIIRDLVHPTTLELTVDGMRIEEGFGGISRACSLVPQTAEIFATTILENITLGAVYEREFVRRFTDIARLTDVIERLPQQFQSSIHEKGVNLSGGERQRLALARGLLACHDKDIVLLDEPTESLDAVTERDIYRNIFREFRGKTILSSVHRLHLLPLFDRVFLFRNGRIVASGTYQELLERSPLFQEMWQHSLHQKEKKVLTSE